MSEKRFCGKCGTEIQASDSFCIKCGEKKRDSESTSSSEETRTTILKENKPTSSTPSTGKLKKVGLGIGNLSKLNTTCTKLRFLKNLTSYSWEQKTTDLLWLNSIGSSFWQTSYLTSM